MRLNKIQQPNGGFEITVKAAVFLFEKLDCGGRDKVAHF